MFKRIDLELAFELKKENIQLKNKIRCRNLRIKELKATLKEYLPHKEKCKECNKKYSLYI